MLTTVLPRLRRAARRLVAAVHKRLSSWTKPAPLAVAAGMAADVVLSRYKLALENALLRQQVGTASGNRPHSGRNRRPDSAHGSREPAVGR